jgi:DNA polymerase
MDAAEPTICTMARENGPVKLWDIINGNPEPQWFVNALADPSAIFVAHNAPFDRAVMERLMFQHPTRAEQWSCTRAQAYAHALPGGLDGLCKALGVPVEMAKIADGKRLIHKFCIPNKAGVYEDPSGPEWEAFCEYALRDIDALRSVYRRLPTHNFSGTNLRYYWLDAKINERGFAVDLPLIESAAHLLDRAKGDSDAIVAEATGGIVTAVTQRDRLLKYLISKGLTLPNLRKSELENVLQQDSLSPEQRLLIEARLEGARASGAKFKRGIAMHVGGRLRYTQQFSGAGRTGRTAHKGFQPGNMPRAVTYNPLAPTLAEQHVPVKAAYIDEIIIPAIRAGACEPLLTGGPNTAAANVLRHCIIAETGNELIVADYKNIESRVLAWIAGEDWKLLAYAAADRGEGADQYKLLYQRFFGGARLEDINEHMRNSGKVVELACGFGGSVGAVVTMCVTYGIDIRTLPASVLPTADPKLIAKAEAAWWRAFLSRDDYDLERDEFMAAHVLVQAYRGANPRIDQLKKALGRAVEGAVRVRGSVYEVGRCKIWANADVLLIQTPSGFRLNYWSPEFHSEEVSDPETGEVEDRSYFTFCRARGPRMIRERSWPGLTLENVVQCIANQLLRYGKLEVDKQWPDSLVLAVHDEAIAEAPVGAIKLEDFKAALCRGWSWCQGLPLAADGWTGPRYGKR